MRNTLRCRNYAMQILGLLEAEEKMAFNETPERHLLSSDIRVEDSPSLSSAFLSFRPFESVTLLHGIYLPAILGYFSALLESPLYLSDHVALGANVFYLSISFKVL